MPHAVVWSTILISNPDGISKFDLFLFRESNKEQNGRNVRRTKEQLCTNPRTWHTTLL